MARVQALPARVAASVAVAWAQDGCDVRRDDACNAHALAAPWSHIAPRRARAPLGSWRSAAWRPSIGACARPVVGGVCLKTCLLLKLVLSASCAQRLWRSRQQRSAPRAALALAPGAPHQASPRVRSPRQVGAAPRARRGRHGRRRQRADGQPDHRGRLQRRRATGPRRLPPCNGSGGGSRDPSTSNRFFSGACLPLPMPRAARGDQHRRGGRGDGRARRATRSARQPRRGGFCLRSLSFL